MSVADKVRLFSRGNQAINQELAKPGNSGAQTPVTWLLMGHKAGDNTQVLALAQALGWPYEIKRFTYHRYELLTNRLLRETLAGTVRRESSVLSPPWPALVITAGRRNEPVARWIRKQSGGHTRIVHVGRPWAPLDCYDLVVTTPLYFLPELPNILHIPLPLHGVSQQRLDEAAAVWKDRFAHLPRPYTAVLLGGDSGKFVFTREKAARLGRQVNALCREQGGSALVTDSARTPPEALAAFLGELDVPHFVYRRADKEAENPYIAYLALADRIVVTGESMSMLAEAASTGKPLAIFDLSNDPGRPWWTIAHNFRYKPVSHRVAMTFGPRRMRRDEGNIPQALIDGGYAVWLGQDFKAERRRATLPDGAAMAAERVRGLFAAPPSSRGGERPS